MTPTLHVYAVDLGWRLRPSTRGAVTALHPDSGRELRLPAQVDEQRELRLRSLLRRYAEPAAPETT